MSKTSATPRVTAAGHLLDRWLTHHEGGQPGDARARAEVPAPAATVEPGPAAAEVAAPPAAEAGAPSAIEAGRAVLEAFNHERLEASAGASAGVVASAGPETVEAATPAPAPPDPVHLGSAAGAPSPEVRERRRPASTPPRDGRSAPGAARASAAAIPVSATPPAVPPTAAPAPTAPSRPPTPIRRPPVTPGPGVVLTSPSHGGRRALTALSLVATAGTAVAGWTAWTSWSGRPTTAVAVAAGLAVLTLVLWTARRRRPTTVVTVQDDVLRIVQGQTRHQFPLAGPHPPIDILGEPGDRGWKVLIQRRSMSPYVVTRSMVDPQAFTELIRQYRPNA